MENFTSLEEIFQIGRIGGNFLIPLKCADVKMNDKKRFGFLLEDEEKDKSYMSRSRRSPLAPSGYDFAEKGTFSAKSNYLKP